MRRSYELVTSHGSPVLEHLVQWWRTKELITLEKSEGYFWHMAWTSEELVLKHHTSWASVNAAVVCWKPSWRRRPTTGNLPVPKRCQPYVEASRVKNVTMNLGGLGPAQWVLGQTHTHTPTDWSSLVSHDGDRQLGLNQNLVDMEEEKTPQESFMIQKRSLHAGGQLPEDSKSDAAQSCPYQGTIPSRQHGQFWEKREIVWTCMGLHESWPMKEEPRYGWCMAVWPFWSLRHRAGHLQLKRSSRTTSWSNAPFKETVSADILRWGWWQPNGASPTLPRRWWSEASTAKVWWTTSLRGCGRCPYDDAIGCNSWWWPSTTWNGCYPRRRCWWTSWSWSTTTTSWSTGTSSRSRFWSFDSAWTGWRWRGAKPIADQRPERPTGDRGEPGDNHVWRDLGSSSRSASWTTSATCPTCSTSTTVSSSSRNFEWSPS